ncbi:MAG TPA: helix-hairpin-helix domain-containing protein [Dissulfurispiraceae bacterium]|nr:helix-hairpin-helix domain-containing protein [Dissulfurispiraceae bacterium]
MKSVAGRVFRGLFVFLAVVSLALTFSMQASAKDDKAAVDLNTASQQQLEDLKGVGVATAKKIIANRPYKSVDELSKAGLSAKKIADLKPFVTVGTAMPSAKPSKAEATPAQPAAAAAKPAVKPAPAVAPSKPDTKAAPVAAGKSAAEKKSTSTLAPGEKVNINTATKEKIEALPGIGPAKAQAVIDGRPYNLPEDIMKVKGIKQGTFNKIKDQIIVK